jgi:hypothetical protein
MESVVINVTLAYQAVFTMPGRRRQEAGYFRGTAPLAIATLGDAEAPVFCRLRSHPKMVAPNEIYDHSIRFHDGRFWRPAAQDNDRSPISLERLRLLVSAPADGGATWDLNPFLEIAEPRLDPPRDYMRRTSTGSWLCGLKTIEETGVRQLHLSGLQDGIKRLNAAAGRFRLIEGALYSECLEPRLVVSVRHSQLEFELITEESTDEGWVVEIFRPDRLAEARRFAAFLVKKQHVGKDSIGLAPRIDVLRPDLLLRDDLVEMAGRHAPRVLKDIAPLVANLPDPALHAFADMRRAGILLRDGKATRSDASVFLSALAVVAAGAATAVADEDSGMSYVRGDSFVRAAGLPLTRWTRFEGGQMPRTLVDEEDEAIASLGARP